MSVSTVRKGRYKHVYVNPTLEKKNSQRIQVRKQSRNQNLFKIIIKGINNANPKQQISIIKGFVFVLTIICTIIIFYVGIVGLGKFNNNQVTVLNEKISNAQTVNTIKQRKYLDKTSVTKIRAKAEALGMVEANQRENIKIQM